MGDPSQLPLWLEYAKELAPVVTAFIAIPIGLISWLAFLHNRQNMLEEGYWTRIAWALDHLMSEKSSERKMGSLTLTMLSKSEVVSQEEREFIRRMIEMQDGPDAG